MCIIVLILAPFSLGLLFEGCFSTKEQDDTIKISRCFPMGFAIMLAAFQLVAVPMIVVATRFTTLLYVWATVIAVLIVFSIYVNRNKLSELFAGRIKTIRAGIKNADRECLVWWVAAIALITVQVCLMVFRTHVDTDDARFIAEAMEAFEKNTIYQMHPITGMSFARNFSEVKKDIISPYPIFIAAISYLTGIKPAVMAHAIFPVVLIPLAYVVMYLFADFVFQKKSYIPVFMFIIAGIVLFSFESVYSWGYTLLGIIWQGRSISAVIMLPLLWYVLMHAVSNDAYIKGKYAAILTVAIANADLSGMGGIMAPIIGGVFALASLITNKKIIPAVLTALCVIPAGVYVIIYKLL